MLSTALTTLAISITSFVLVMLLVQGEQKKGRRFLLGGFRGWLDGVIGTVERWLGDTVDHFVKYVVRLNWYYGIHSFLRALLKLIVASYEQVEKIFEHNRRLTKQLRAEKRNRDSRNHLSEMAAHKAETKLTPAEARKRKKHHLEGF